LVSGGFRDGGEELEGVFAAAFPICRNAMSLADAMAQAEADLQRTARNVVRLWLSARL
jgi:glycerate kinase